jgi:hypothetical protein
VLDYISIPLEKEYSEEHKECSVDPGIFHLCRSVLELAILDLRARGQRERALSWIMSNEIDHIFYFLPICSLLKIDPFQIRRNMVVYLAKGGIYDPKARLFCY